MVFDLRNIPFLFFTAWNNQERIELLFLEMIIHSFVNDTVINFWSLKSLRCCNNVFVILAT